MKLILLKDQRGGDVYHDYLFLLVLFIPIMIYGYPKFFSYLSYFLLSLAMTTVVSFTFGCFHTVPVLFFSFVLTMILSKKISFDVNLTRSDIVYIYVLLLIGVLTQWSTDFRFTQDSRVYYMPLARLLSKINYVPSLLTPEIGKISPIILGYQVSYPPTLVGLGALTIRIIGISSSYILSVVPLTFYSLFVTFCVLLWKCQKVSVYLCTIIFPMMSPLYYYSSAFLEECVLMFAVTGFFYFFLRKDDMRASIFCGLISVSRMYGIAFPFLYGIKLLYQRKFKELSTLFIFTVPSLLWILRNVKVFGNPFYPAMVTYTVDEYYRQIYMFSYQIINDRVNFLHTFSKYEAQLLFVILFFIGYTVIQDIRKQKLSFMGMISIFVFISWIAFSPVLSPRYMIYLTPLGILTFSRFIEDIVVSVYKGSSEIFLIFKEIRIPFIKRYFKLLDVLLMILFPICYNVYLVSKEEVSPSSAVARVLSHRVEWIVFVTVVFLLWAYIISRISKNDMCLYILIVEGALYSSIGMEGYLRVFFFLVIAFILAFLYLTFKNAFTIEKVILKVTCDERNSYFRRGLLTVIFLWTFVSVTSFSISYNPYASAIDFMKQYEGQTAFIDTDEGFVWYTGINVVYPQSPMYAGDFLKVKDRETFMEYLEKTNCSFVIDSRYKSKFEYLFEYMDSETIYQDEFTRIWKVYK